MGKSPKSNKIQVTLPAGMRVIFDQLLARDLYGSESSAVARHLISIGLDRLVEQNRLIDVPITPAPAGDENQDR